MARDNQGNDLSSVEVPVTGAIMLVPYEAKNVITSAMIASSLATPDLPEAYNPQTACLGLLTQDGGPQDGREADDAISFFQQGYSLNSDPTLTTTFTVAEDNEMTRRITIGEPDENGVYQVRDMVQDTKWMAYQETTLKDGRVVRRAGVVQVTGNEPNAAERGQVRGVQLTLTWQNDGYYGGAKYLQSYYNPADGANPPYTNVTLSKYEVTGEPGGSELLTVQLEPSNGVGEVKVESDLPYIATGEMVDGQLKITFESMGEAVVTVKAGSASAEVAVTVIN